MIEETAQVVRVDGHLAWVETQRKSTCGACQVNKGCGSGVLAKVIGNKMVHLRVLNDVGACVGDEVVIGIDDEMLVRSSFAVYAVPLLCLLFGAWLGETANTYLVLTESESITVLSGMGGLFGGFYWLRYYSQKISRDKKYQPQILRSHRYTETRITGPV